MAPRLSREKRLPGSHHIVVEPDRARLAAFGRSHEPEPPLEVDVERLGALQLCGPDPCRRGQMRDLARRHVEALERAGRIAVAERVFPLGLAVAGPRDVAA